MRPIAFFLVFTVFFVGLPLVATAQSNGTVPPAMALVISGEQVGSSETQDIAYADLDNDGDIDAFVMEWDHSEIWFNEGDGHHNVGNQRFGDAYQNEVALGDIDNDGDVDAFITKQSQLGKSNEVWLNNGIGIFTDSGQRLGTDGYSAHLDVKLVDFDQDNDLDAFVVANGIFCGNSRLWINDGGGNFTDSGITEWSACHHKIAVGDINGDQKVDVIFNTNHGLSGLTSWSNLGSNIFTQTQVITDSYHTANLTLGDVDSDDDLDLFTTGMLSPSVLYNKVWLNDGKGNLTDSGRFLTPLPALATLQAWDSEVTLTDIDHDGDLDGMTVTRFARDATNWPKIANVVVVRFNDGLGHFEQGLLTFIDPTAPTSIDSSRIALLPLAERLYLPFIQISK